MEANGAGNWRKNCNMESSTNVLIVAGHSKVVNSVSFSPDGKLILSLQPRWNSMSMEYRARKKNYTFIYDIIVENTISNWQGGILQPQIQDNNKSLGF